MRRLRLIARGFMLTMMASVMVFVGAEPALAQAANPNPTLDPYNLHKGDLIYYTNNGIIFYEGGELHCGDGAAIVGGAAEMLKKQTKLDPQWIPVIIASASKAHADPIAMASLLFWEHRGFPKFGAGPQNGESDVVGRGPWQIIRASWPSSAGSYDSGVYNPQAATDVAATIVKSYGGAAGIPIGSIDQDFSKGKNTPSMATVAKNYNSGVFTWRNPGVAGYKAGGRSWQKGDNGAWFAQKQGIIDDYIVGMTNAYYMIATGQVLSNVNTDDFVQAGLANQDKIKGFKITDGSNGTAGVDQQCDAGGGNGNIVQTALGLAWHDRDRAGNTDVSTATPAYQKALKDLGYDPQAYHIATDCGVFVAIVMRLSGADPTYAKRTTSVQLNYVKTSGKYDVFTNFTNESQMKPGDILVYANGGEGHTYIYTGPYPDDKNPKKIWKGSSASFHQRVPMATNLYFDSDGGDHFTVARLKPDQNAAQHKGTEAP